MRQSATVMLMVLSMAAAPPAAPSPSATTSGTTIFATTTSVAAPATTQPVAVDLSTPKSAARSLFLAIQAKDVAAVRAALDAADEISPDVNIALAELLVAGSRMSDAGTRRFGKSGDPIGRPMITVGTLASVESAAVKEIGETAVLQIPGHRRTMTFRRRNDKWRLVPEPIVGAIGAATQPVPPQHLKLLQNMAIAINELARDIENGKYQSSQDAERYVQEKLHAVMIETFKPDRAPARGAATRP